MCREEELKQRLDVLLGPGGGGQGSGRGGAGMWSRAPGKDLAKREPSSLHRGHFELLAESEATYEEGAHARL